MTQARVQGYLPQDRPPLPALLSLGLQHVLTMFPATVLVAILTGFDVGVTLFASGLAMVLALLLSRGRIPLYYGSSFAYIVPVVAVAQRYGVPVAQVGIVATAFVSILAGLLIRRVGRAALDRVLPPIVTGAMAIVIGIALAKAALDMATGACCLDDRLAAQGTTWFLVAVATLLITVCASVFLQGRGLWGMLPVLIGALSGYLIALVAGLVDFSPVAQAAWFAVPRFTLPDFSHPAAWTAVLAIAPIAIATIPESTAHLYQIGLYVDRLAEELGRPLPRIRRLIGLNLVLDGLGDLVNGLLGGCAGTNYGENNSLMAITRNYSAPVLVAAGMIAMALGFVGKLAALVGTLPTAVVGGLAIYLFGVIGLQGVALMQAERVDLFNPRQLAVGATILVIGIGGSAFPNGAIPVGAHGLPAIATAAVAGIVLNLLLNLAPRRDAVQTEEAPAMDAPVEAVA
ncbi:uracil-xanthine permease family protein [Kallotenue papyrolyticum]|uniref:uracil-xanthine permease family protein n=1 Tax=Kallotenue papyrolyticum TaxID=1325125 RepID=UPI0004B84561|nr:solute carrier family 23 protein [Kallotenue papyrolyticum]